jgi:5-methyltetrahydrofolate--homocysteine methyltransferase
MIQANAGMPVVAEGMVRYPETPDDFAAAVPGLLDAGVSILGGCCGTTPAHVQAMREALDAR